MDTKGTLTPRPHARLITMIGEQLIRNEKIALIELIKNSYDADANWVQIRFSNFDNNKGDLKIRSDSCIEIEDDGIGMDFDTIRNSWLNPASPQKYLLHKKGKDKTAKGRIMQGEKGIGRFAAFKLGFTVEIFTRSAEKDSQEIYLKSDLSIYDDELISKKGGKDPVFLDNIQFSYEIRPPAAIIQKEISIFNEKIARLPNGTLIKITNIKGTWSEKKIEDIATDCLKLISPFNKFDFIWDITLNGETKFSSYEKTRIEDLLSIAALKISGRFDEKYKLHISANDNPKVEKSLRDFSSDEGIKKSFFDNEKIRRHPECGPFEFVFHIFDLERDASLQSSLSKDDREIIKSHRTYLYRDDVRVYPYGDSTDDWLELDIHRGKTKAGFYLSNDQTVGYISITHSKNPNLRDKTNREGLMDVKYAYEDLKTIVLAILGFAKSEFDKYKILRDIKKIEREKENGLLSSTSAVEKTIESLHNHLEEAKDTKGETLVKKLVNDYKREIKEWDSRLEIVEDLAGVGITVEAASHDLMVMMQRSKETLNLLLESTKAKNIDGAKVTELLEKLRGQFAFIEDQLHGIQPLFRSSKRRSIDWRIKDIIEKVKRYYSASINKLKLEIIVEEQGPPLIIKSSEGILLQVFMNLMDNAVYWLETREGKNRQIKIILDGNNFTTIFADNGPGVAKEDLPFIFRAFFSTKGLQGRGLGLYIARQLLGRYDFEIGYIQREKDKVLRGANFLINFAGTAEND